MNEDEPDDRICLSSFQELSVVPFRGSILVSTEQQQQQQQRNNKNNTTTWKNNIPITSNVYSSNNQQYQREWKPNLEMNNISDSSLRQEKNIEQCRRNQVKNEPKQFRLQMLSSYFEAQRQAARKDLQQAEKPTLPVNTNNIQLNNKYQARKYNPKLVEHENTGAKVSFQNVEDASVKTQPTEDQRLKTSHSSKRSLLKSVKLQNETKSANVLPPNEQIEEERNRILEYLTNPDANSSIKLPARIEERIRRHLEHRRKQLELKTILKAKPDMEYSSKESRSTIRPSSIKANISVNLDEDSSDEIVATPVQKTKMEHQKFNRQRLISEDLMRLMIRKAQQRKMAKQKLSRKKECFPLRSPFETFADKTGTIKRIGTSSSLRTSKSILKKDTPSKRISVQNHFVSRTNATVSGSVVSEPFQEIPSRGPASEKRSRASAELDEILHKILLFKKAKAAAEEERGPMKRRNK